MFKKRRPHQVPELNTTSTADISFMLLILFLVTTSMDSDKGMLHRMAPPTPPDMEQVEKNVKERNIMELTLTEGDTLKVDGQCTDMHQLPQRIRTFVLNPQHLPTLAEEPSRHILNVKTAGKTTYEAYFRLKNTIRQAYEEMWDGEAQRQYHHPYSQLSAASQRAIRQSIPERISDSTTPQ